MAGLLAKQLGELGTSVLIGCGWWGALLVAHLILLPWVTWPEPSDAWKRMLLCTVPFVLVLGLSQCCGEKPWRLLIAVLFASLGPWLVLPSGEGWKDIEAISAPWLACMIPSIVWNGWSMEQLAKRDAGRWSNWVWIAALGASVAFALGVYATLAQWLLSVLAAVLGIGLVGMFRKNNWGAIISFPAAFVLAGSVAWNRFLSHSPEPWWVYGLVLFTPSLVAEIDRTAKLSKGWQRILLAGVLSAIPVGIVVLRLVMSNSQETW